MHTKSHLHGNYDNPIDTLVESGPRIVGQATDRRRPGVPVRAAPQRDERSGRLLNRSWRNLMQMVDGAPAPAADSLRALVSSIGRGARYP